MSPDDLITMVLADAPRITQAITLGAGWEVWMQVELGVLLRTHGLQAAREVPYDPPVVPPKYLDTIAQDAVGRYAIELKVESATNAGAAVMAGVIADRAKLAGYTPAIGNRWVVGIAYSDVAKGRFSAFAAAPANASTYRAANDIAVLVCRI